MDWPWLVWAGIPTVLSSTYVCYVGATRHRDVRKMLAAKKRRGGEAAEEAEAQVGREGGREGGRKGSVFNFSVLRGDDAT